jgi:hypothetical protein
MTQKLLEENEMIASFLGYTYKYGASEDFSSIGGIYSDAIYYSKVPLKFEFTHDDGRVEGMVRDNSVNHNDYFIIVTNGWNDDGFDYELKYYNSWDWIMPACKKIFESYFSDREHIYEALHKCDIDETFKSVVNFLKFWNDPEQEKMIWVGTPEWVLEFIKDHKVKDFRPDKK